jgi:lantibiotic modifying enzyme
MRSDERAFTDLAARLAHEIASSATWYLGRCNWVGALGRDETRLSGRAELAALGPDLYGGTSGVALFLAEAAAKLGDDTLRRTALGAAQVGLDHADRIAPPVRDGLYAGQIGIAYATGRVAMLLGAEELLVRARGLLIGRCRARSGSGAADVMSGCAGAVLGLLAFDRLTGEQRFLAAAESLGDELIAHAVTGRAGWSWADPAQPAMHHLCGYAHGAAGIGHALAELAVATAEARFRAAALHAFDYERSWLDPRAGTWPDLRGIERRAGHDTPAPAADSWCNGAPGLALSRVRAAALLDDAALHRDAGVALATCDRHVADLLARAPDDFSLCHGAAGAADALLSAGADARARATRLGRRGIELYAGPGRTRFPSGVPLGETPGLLLGRSGVGMFYLRLADPGMPSPLLICPFGPLTATASAA